MTPLGKILPCVAAIIVLSACGQDRSAGGSGSETTNTVRLAVVDRSGRPVPGARAFVRTENDTTGDAVVRVADEAGFLDLEPPVAPTWIEIRSGDTLAALATLRGGHAEALTAVLSEVSSLTIEGLAQGAVASLPGLGRTATADAAGTIRFTALPPGAARARWNGFDGAVPLPSGGGGRCQLGDSGVATSWPSDGSLDSVALRRVFDAVGLAATPLDSLASPIEGRLARIHLDGRALDSLPSSLGSLDFLREINARRNGLTTLPVSLALLPRLSYLDIGSNPLAKVPEVVRDLDSMRILVVDSSGIGKLPDWLGSLPSMWFLDVSWNALDSLPSSLTSLRRLAILCIYRNRIVSLPDGMESMDSLRQIWAETNQLRRLPDSFAKLPALHTLQLDNNPLDSLPSNLGALTTLRDLRLTGTSLRNLPSSLATLPLERLDVFGLALCSLDSALASKLDTLAPGWRADNASRCP